MIEKYIDITEDALLRVRNGIDMEDYEKFKTLGYVGCDGLTQEQLKKLKALNLHLVEYEKEIKKQVIDVIDYSMKKVKDPTDWITGVVGIEVVMSFFLADDDPCCRDDSDNLLVIMSQDFCESRDIYGIDDGINHNEFRGWTKDVLTTNIDHPMCGDYHCWIFHGLYDHTELQWEEILRIGSIDVDVKLRMDNERRDVPNLYL